MKSRTQQKKNKSVTYVIPQKGSLGLLAAGHIGLRAWRKVKKEEGSKKK